MESRVMACWELKNLEEGRTGERDLAEGGVNEWNKMIRDAIIPLTRTVLMLRVLESLREQITDSSILIVFVGYLDRCPLVLTLNFDWFCLFNIESEYHRHVCSHSSIADF